jgi:hypothetical protein
MSLQRLLWAAFAAALFLSPAHAAYDVGDIVCETSTTTGTGTLNLGGAVTNYATFISQITSGSSVNYHITASDGTLETGVGVLTDAAPDTLTRVAYWSTDGSGAELTLPAGTHTVCLGPTTQMFAGMKGFQLYTDDAGAVGGILPFWHDSASAADGDIAADIQVYAGADDEEVGRIALEVDDGATTTEDTQWRFFTDRAGSSSQRFAVGDGAIVGAGTTFPGVGSLLVYDNADATVGAVLQLQHADPSADAADDVGTIEVYGGADEEEIGSIVLDLLDPATTTEDTEWIFTNRVAGSDLASLTLGGTAINGDVGVPIFTLPAGSATFPSMFITQTDDSSGSPFYGIFKETSTPAAGDFTGGMGVRSRDSAANVQAYGGLHWKIGDPTSTSEDSYLELQAYSAGSALTVLTLGGVDLVDAAGGTAFISDAVIGADDNSAIRLYETEANGDNYKGFISAAANTADTTCTFENDANFIPDSCVGDGVDASDARLKDVIGPAGDVGAMIDGIKIYDYKWNTDAPDESEDIRKGKHGFGPIAQELFNLNADFVDVGGDNPLTDPWTWKPEKVVPYLIVETQSLRKRVKALETRTSPTCYGIKLGNACIGVSM